VRTTGIKNRKQHEAMYRKRLRKKVKLQCLEAEKRCPHERILHATMPQIPEHRWAIHCWSVSQSHGWMSDWTNADIKSRLNTQGQKLTKVACLQNFEAYTWWRKRRYRQKTHQKGPDQRTEAVSDARLAPSANHALLRKLFKKKSP